MFSLAPHVAHRLYDYFSGQNDNQNNFESCAQAALREASASNVDPSLLEQAEPMTEVHGPIDVRKICVSALLEMVMVEQNSIMSNKLKEIHTSIKEDAQVMKAIDETLGELAEVSVLDQTVVVTKIEELQAKLKKLQSLGFTSKLITQAELTKKDRDALQLHLQHKRSSRQEDIKMKRQDFQEVNERRNNLYQTLMNILSTLKQSIDRIFSAR